MSQNSFYKNQLNPVLDQLKRLKVEMDKDIPTMPEELFRTYFLGLLTSKTPVDLSPWFQIVGHPQQKCHITRNGQIAYTIPPLVNTVSTGHGGDRSAQVLTAEIQHRALTSQQADAMLLERIGTIKPDLESDAENEVLQMWKKVYVENGLEWDGTLLSTPVDNSEGDLFDGESDPA